MILPKVGHPALAILHQTWPILLSQLAVGAFGIIDVMLISHLSAQQSAAVGVGMNIFNTISIGFLAILFILPPNISKLYANKNYHEVASTVCQGTYLAIFLTIPIVILLYFPDALIHISRLASTTEATARQYLLGLAGATPAILLFRVFYAYAAGTLQPQRVMHLNFAGLIVKLPLAWFLVFGWGAWQGLGALGCSISSMLILWTQVGFIAWQLYRSDSDSERLIMRDWTFPRLSKIVCLLSGGLPIGAGVFVDYTAHTVIALFVARLSDVVMAGHQIAANLAFITYLVPLALSAATTVLVSHAMGKKQGELVRKMAFASIKLTACIALSIGLLLFVGHQALASLYTNHHVIQHIASPLIAIAGIYHFFDALVTVFLGILRAYNKMIMPALLLGGTLWFFGLGGGYYLAFNYQGGMGAIGFWAALTVAEMLSCLLIGSYTWYISCHILLQPEERYSA